MIIFNNYKKTMIIIIIANKLIQNKNKKITKQSKAIK